MSQEVFVELIEKKKDGKDKQREVAHEKSLAEKVLNKSNGWDIKDGNKFQFKNGSIVAKNGSSVTKKES